MKFIIPKNYKYNSKILGFIDYTTAVIDLIIGIILFFIIKLIFKDIGTQIYIFISLFLPILLFSILGAGGENIIYFSIYIFKFFKNRKVYFYDKTTGVPKGNCELRRENDSLNRFLILLFNSHINTIIK